MSWNPPWKVRALSALVPPKTVYIGIFLTPESKRRLLARFPAIHPTVYAEHLTLAFGKAMAPEYPIGEIRRFSVVGYAEDPKGQTVVIDFRGIEDLLAPGQLPHVTISTAAGVPPKYSKELLPSAVPVEPLVLEGTIEPFPRV